MSLILHDWDDGVPVASCKRCGQTTRGGCSAVCAGQPWIDTNITENKPTRTALRVQGTIDTLRAMCSDPDGPLYGSDIVPVIAKLIDDCLQICRERDACADAFDRIAEEQRTAKLQPKCANCEGTGQEFRHWNNDYVECPSCMGKGF